MKPHKHVTSADGLYVTWIVAPVAVREIKQNKKTRGIRNGEMKDRTGEAIINELITCIGFNSDISAVGWCSACGRKIK